MMSKSKKRKTASFSYTTRRHGIRDVTFAGRAAQCRITTGKAHALGYERGRRRRTVTFRFPFFFLKSSILGDSI